MKNIISNRKPVFHKFALIFILAAAYFQIGLAQNTDSTSVANDSLNTDSLISKTIVDSLEDHKELPPKPLLKIDAFAIGEKLTFKIRYGFIKAGEAQMKVLGIKEMDKQDVYHIQTTAKSVPFFDVFYKVRDEVNSFVTVAGFYPLRFQKKLREGDYYVDLNVEYLHQDSIARVNFIRYEDDNMKIKNQKKYDLKIPPYISDVLSSFYYIRTQPLEVGKSVSIVNHESDKIYDLEVKVYRREIVDTDAGEFRCLVVEPLLKGEGLFSQKGRLLIWLTDDDLKIPVQMTSEVAVGHITTELIKIEGVKKPIKAKLD